MIRYFCYAIFIIIIFQLDRANAIDRINLADLKILEDSLNSKFSLQLLKIDRKIEIKLIENNYVANSHISDDYKNGNLRISIYSGLKFNNHINELGFKVMICHELGHFLGGAPYKSGNFSTNLKVSKEGKADYWASYKCLPKMFETDDETILIKAIKNFILFLSDKQDRYRVDHYFFEKDWKVKDLPVRGDRNYPEFPCRWMSLKIGVEDHFTSTQEKRFLSCW